MKTSFCLPLLVLSFISLSSCEAYSQKGVDAYGGAYSQKGVDADMDGDYKTAMKWYTLAAEQGHAASQYNLGVCYANGQYGVPQDPVYAHMWWNIAASSGHDDAKKPRYYCKKYVCVSNRRSTETCS
tara:strand:- start:308 stop:688 length:381 start_codon:yes stop_codon:yes gene_type:complete